MARGRGNNHQNDENSFDPNNQQVNGNARTNNNNIGQGNNRRVQNSQNTGNRGQQPNPNNQPQNNQLQPGDPGGGSGLNRKLLAGGAFILLLAISTGAYFMFFSSTVTVEAIDTDRDMYVQSDSTVEVRLLNHQDSRYDGELVLKYDGETKEKDASLSSGTNEYQFQISTGDSGNKTLRVQYYDSENNLVVEDSKSVQVKPPTISGVDLEDQAVAGTMNPMRVRLSYSSDSNIPTILRAEANGETKEKSLDLYGSESTEFDIEELLVDGENTVEVSLEYDGKTVSSSTSTITYREPTVETDLSLERQTGKFHLIKQDGNRSVESYDYYTVDYSVRNTGDVRAEGLTYKLKIAQHRAIDRQTTLAPGDEETFQNSYLRSSRVSGTPNSFPEGIQGPKDTHNAIFRSVEAQVGYYLNPDIDEFGAVYYPKMGKQPLSDDHDKVKRLVTDSQDRLLKGPVAGKISGHSIDDGKDKNYEIQLIVDVPGKEENVVESRTLSIAPPNEVEGEYRS